MQKELGRKPDNAEMFLRTHQKKEDKSWVESKAETVYNNYSQGVADAENAATQAASLEENETPKSVDKNKLWIEHAGGRNKRTKRCYGDCNLDDDIEYEFSSHVTCERIENDERDKVWNEKFDGLSKDFNDLNGKVTSVLDQQSRILELLQGMRGN